MASAITKTDYGFGAAFDELIRRRRDEPAWLRELREVSFARFQETGFPSVHEEEWKYTNVSPIAKTPLTPIAHANGTALTADELSRFAYDEAPTRLVFVNGILRRD